MYIADFNKLPNFSKLFLDYVSVDEEISKKLNPFFNAHFRSNEDFFKVIDSKIQNYNANRYFDKALLIEILKRQNMDFGGNDKTASNIELLKNDDTFAIVTGQQVGLYTGNMYTIYKTITTIKLAENLKTRFPQFNFVPVFWLESEDHDLEESNHVHIINKQNELVRVGFEDPASEGEDENPKRSAIPVGGIKFDESIQTINTRLFDGLMETDYKENVTGKVSSFYAPGNDFKTAFARMLSWMFGEHGLVFVDPADKEIKKLLTPVFEKELMTSPRLCESLIDTSAELEKNYDLQVKPKVINLFFLHNGNRLLIEPRENDRFALKNSKRRFDREELMNILFESPELFSPNVVLRPICQDYLLPTVAYVGGPSEISYFAQFKSAYNHYDLTMPVIFPRASVTVLENKITKFVKNYNVSFEEIFDHKALITKVVNKLSEVKIDDEVSKVQDELNKAFYELKNMTAKVDQTLLSGVDNLKERMNQNLEQFKGKLINAQAKKSDVATNQIDKVVNNIYPNHNLQERVINVLYFLNKYGGNFINKLFSEIEIDNFNHEVIEIGGEN
jgi:bacillithiol biosynthesis cysteine-adding enzyme BshC